MTEKQAERWVRDHADFDHVDEEMIEECFRAIFGREPDAKDRREGLWPHCLAAVR